jgi:predicted dehydrogenase
VTLTIQRRDGRRESRDYAWTDTVRANVEAFARAAQGQGSYIFTDAQKIGNVAVLEAVTRSVATNAPVAVAAVA